MKKLTLTNGYKLIEKKKITSTVIYIYLLLQKNVGITITVFNNYFNGQFS